ncbi:MAG: T9SS type A sorting domain-containing protein [Bacteroidetes bacterium]|nr:T9SS type A sorting domain-containing protein [Bacteroidota bacterium]
MKKTLQLFIFMAVFISLIPVKKIQAQYCTPTTSCTFPDIITNVTFAGINRTSVCDAPSGGWSYYASPPGTIVQGLPYTISITTGGDVEGVAAWIDYNLNQVFEASESLFTPAFANTNPATYTFTVNVPIGATPGASRLRVRCKYAGAPLVGDNNPCVNYTWGETEDYLVNILANTPCSGTPTAGTATGTPLNPCPGVTVNYSLVGASLLGGLSYQWLRSPTGLGGSWITIPGATNSVHSEVPPAGTTYYRCIVTCTNPGGGFDTSVAFTNTVQPWSPLSSCYCISTADFPDDQVISNVTMGSLNNTTTCGNLIGTQGVGVGTANQYANFTATVPAPVIYTGLSQSFSLGLGTCGGSVASYASIFIDYNHNASFSDPGEEVYTNIAIPNLPTVVSGNFTVPGGALSGVTRMRVIMQSSWIGPVLPCGNYAYGETEDYLVNIVPPSPHDPAVTAISGAAGNCYSANQSIVVSVTNFGSNPIVVATNPITCTLAVTGPLGVNYYYGNVNPAITLSPFGGNAAAVLIPGVNMYAGGTYYLNTTLSIGNAGGVVNGNLLNDSLQNAIVRINYRPTAGPDFHLCQYNNILFGQGLTVSGCATPINDSVEVVFNFTPVPDNTGATTGGTSQTVPGAGCANQYAGNFANAILPNLPIGASFTQNAVLTVTNLSSNFITEPRFILYSGSPIAPNLFAPCPQGYNVNAGDIVLAGQSIGNNANFTNVRHITPAQLSNMYSTLAPNSPINIGYFETWNDNFNTSDIGVNAGSPTTVKLKIYYQYVPSSFEWYNVAVGGGNLYSLSPFNPITTPGSGITNSNTPGTTTFYAACVGSSTCRVPVNLVIDPTPLAYQDTIALCESPAGSNGAIFDLTTADGGVSGNVPGLTVQYYGDQGLFYLLPTPTADTTGTTFVYSKVSNGFGCYSSDTLMLQVNGQPEFPALYLTGNACAPASIDVATLIDPFTTVPPGSDTLYFSDPACTIPHPNPHNITVTDTVYIVIATNTTPVCSDTAIALITLSTAGNLIANQDILNYSIPGFVGCNTFTLTDGNTDTLYNPADCKRIVHITDVANGTSLGSTQVCEWIDASPQVHNGQPYVNRHYQITPSAQTSATVCLYFLEDDFAQFNSFSLLNGWPQITPNINLAISKVDNGDIMDIGHTAIAIPNANITTSYDPGTTVWTVCFPVDSFSYFYAHAANPGNVPLPVSLLSFTGKKVSNSSLLQWTTSSEQNNSHFVVEHSRDGKSFQSLSAAIASQAANGNSTVSLSYDYTDQTPYVGNNYYRLQQVDLDGNISYSKVLNVYHGDETVVNLYPNPVNTQLNVEINTPKASVANIKIMDATGRVVRAVDMQLQAGNNKSDINMEGLADGVYMIKITNSKGLQFSQTVRKN